jgi:N-acetylmuramoyl-L-alanine amidase CwlA
MTQMFSTSGTPPMIGQRLSSQEWLAYINAFQLPASCTRLVLHHTYVPNQAQWNGLTSMRGMQRYYAGLGWTSAPHLYVAPDGIWLFTPLDRVGIHAGTGNSGRSNGVFWYSIGLEMVGDFDKVRPSGAVWEQSKAVMGSISRKTGIAPRRLISFHRDYTNQKSCPGWAVTKEWVWAEVEMWMNGTNANPNLPIGTPGTPSPNDEQVLEKLMNESYSRRSNGYNSDWAFHQVAVERKLGVPFAPTNDINVDGKDWRFQVFAKDTLYCEVPNWGDVKLLSETMDGSIPPTGLARGMLEASYLAGGAPFDINEVFHHFAFAVKLGPPIGPITTLAIAGQYYRVAPFAVDTLYAPVNDPSSIQQLSRLAASTDQRELQIREAILAELYRRAGTTYQPTWAFHQAARNYGLGAPLSGDYRVRINNNDYNIQIFALDTLYNIVPHWGDVRRLSNLLPSQAQPSLRAREEASLTAKSGPAFAKDAVLEPPSTPFVLLQYTPESFAFSSRQRSRVQLIVLHGDKRSSQEALASITALESEYAPHYYIDAKGEILQLVRDEHAAWHSGMGLWKGRRQNINRISIGVTLEDQGEKRTQIAALRWLIGQVRERYSLDEDAVFTWDSFPEHSKLESFETSLDWLELDAN